MKLVLFWAFLSIFMATAIITLLGITNKIDIKDGYLKVLVTTLLLELTAAVIGAYNQANFFSESHAIAINQLPNDIQAGTTDISLQKIDQLLLKKSTLTQELAIKSDAYRQCNVTLSSHQAELEVKTNQLKQCIIPSKGILATLLSLQEDIKAYGPTVNLSWEAEKKTDIAYRVIHILGELGYHASPPEASTERAIELLKAYQESKQINPASGKLGRKTFIQLLNDYIIIETNGG